MVVVVGKQQDRIQILGNNNVQTERDIKHVKQGSFIPLKNEYVQVCMLKV